MAKKKKSSASRSLTTMLLGIILTIGLFYFGLGSLEDNEDIPPELRDLIRDILGSDSDTSFSGDWYTVYFTEPQANDDTIEKVVIKAIDSANETLDGVFFEFNVEGITEAVIRAEERGVEIRLVMDDDHAVFDDESTVEDLEDAGIEIVDDSRGALMHHKFMIIDGKELWMGSMNFTQNGLYRNNNNLVRLENAGVIENYQAEFEELFVDKAFSRTANPRPVPNRELKDGDTIVETYFSPEDGVLLEERIVELINDAESSVYIMTFVMTSDLIGEAALARHNDGIKVEAVFENTGSLTEFSEMPRLGCAGANVRQDGNPGILHHKVIIIDEDIVLTGSFNFSNSARDNNSENVLIIHDAEFAKGYVEEFERRFAEGEEPSRSEMSC